jgi:hypothetical protein
MLETLYLLLKQSEKCPAVPVMSVFSIKIYNIYFKGES